MNELNIEEKAKAYDKALKVLHKYDGANIMFSQSLKEEMFPELTESKDDSIRKTLIAVVNLYYGEGEDEEKAACLNWLEKQGKKGTNGNEREISILAWSEEDERIRKEIINFFEHYPNIIVKKERRNDWIAWLEKQGEQKPVWSEEDDDDAWLNDIISKAECNLQLNKGEINWLKSLRPQNTWKPSDEQVKALNYVINLMASSESPKENDYYYNVFKGLREQLMKLRGE